ncbi:hypothetical protein [Streptomyces sp. enrichment culture]|uniref:hypothetical protein n=1 Tax=Streptomyces sp. enrichment culture TaxID=1795815 RepID=UPI003F54B967
MVTMDNSNDLTGNERRIETLAGLTAPDEQDPADDLPELTAAPLMPARRGARTMLCEWPQGCTANLWDYRRPDSGSQGR